METLLNEFCREFESVIRPLEAPFRDCAKRLARAPGVLAARHVLPEVNNLRHQLTVVADKVAEQQAYVLIFGPLKSGKSTLMNAMSSAYVSEVTSLPAYPCMVYVAHAENRDVAITHYDNEVDRPRDLGELRAQLARAHHDLARHIRRAEERGDAFDVARHFPDAIRRIDLRLPAGDLAESGAVLVDTPGLYTRMRFGYDQMTRDFRDTAACAIFVVKSENLFLEQVFEEFTELLDLFTRIFLVVNLDTTKKDLKADGSLAPSLEREDPIRIIEAFENLAMSSALKEAADNGRLRIYPIDLLTAASQRLRDNEEESDGREGADEADEHRGQADFDAFLTNLTDYLNSNEYLVAFLGDSIRRARRLLREAGALPDRKDMQAVKNEIADLRDEHRGLIAHGNRLDTLRGFAWKDAVNVLWRDVKSEMIERGEGVRKRTSKALFDSLDGWFAQDDSVQVLVEDELEPHVVRMQDELLRSAHDVVKARSASGTGGLAVTDDVLMALAEEEIDLDGVARDAAYEPPERPEFEERAPILEDHAIPVRRSVWDWVLLRPTASVQKKLFGPRAKRTKALPRNVKTARLRGKARESMQAAIGEYVASAHPQDLAVATKLTFVPFAERVLGTVGSTVDRRRSTYRARRKVVEGRLAILEPIERAMNALREAIGEAQAGLEPVADRYARTDPSALRAPAKEVSTRPATKQSPRLSM